jgi:hypothetical protein
MRVLLALIAAVAAPVAAYAADGGAALRPLAWSAKREVATTAPQAPADQRPAPMALSGQYLRGRMEASEPPPPPTPPGRYRAAQPPAYEPFVPQVPLPLQNQATRTASLPASLYAAPVTAHEPPPQLRPAQPAAEPALAPVAAAPAPALQPAANQAAPVRLAAAPPAPRTIGEPPRFYSVHRDYGMAPDAIPEPPAGANRYVLIGPPDGAAPPPNDNDDDQNDRPPAF